MSLFCALLISLHHEENKNTVGFKGSPGFDILGEVRCAEKQKSWKLDLVLVTNHTWEPFKMISTYLHVHIPQKKSIKKAYSGDQKNCTVVSHCNFYSK